MFRTYLFVFGTDIIFYSWSALFGSTPPWSGLFRLGLAKLPPVKPGQTWSSLVRPRPLWSAGSAQPPFLRTCLSLICSFYSWCAIFCPALPWSGLPYLTMKLKKTTFCVISIATVAMSNTRSISNSQKENKWKNHPMLFVCDKPYSANLIKSL